MNKLIELKNLTKNFDDQQVLRGINLDIMRTSFSPFWDQVAAEKLLPFESLQALRSQAAEKYCLTALRFPSFLHIKER